MTAKLVVRQVLAAGTVLLAGACALPSTQWDQTTFDRARLPTASLVDAPATVPAVDRGFTNDPFGLRRAGRRIPVRIEAFHERLELADLDVDFEDVADIGLKDTEQERTGVRAIIGNDKISAFVQFFKEDFRAPALLQRDFDTYGVAAGVMGTPQIAGSERVKVVVPLRYELGVAAGIEDDAAGFEQEWAYYQSSLEAGIGVRVVGLQPSVGVAINSVFGLFESDNPSSPANVDWALVDGFNIAAYGELLYQPDYAPVVARIRGMFGDVSGVLFSLGVRF